MVTEAAADTTPPPGPDPTSDEGLALALTDRRAERLTREGRRSGRPQNPIASDLTDCLRYQVLRIIAWELLPDFPPEAMEAIENGRVKERAMLDQLRAEGWEVVEEQAPFEIRQPVHGKTRIVLRGKLDGKLRVPGSRELLSLELKDTSHFMHARLQSVADFDRSPWTVRWRRQKQAEMLGENLERGLFVIGHRGKRTALVLHLDYQEAESILQLCVRTMELVAEFEEKRIDGEKAEQAFTERGIGYADFAVHCRDCVFRDRACFPPEPAPSASAVRPELAPDAERYAELKPLAAEYKKLQKHLQSETEGVATIVAGEWIIEGQERTRNMKPQPAKPAHTQSWWENKVRRAGERK